MNDLEIVNLYWARDERAIRETAQKYSAYCFCIARNILNDVQYAEECAADTWMAAWNGIPPARPGQLSAYLGRITRNLSLKRWRAGRALKRGGDRVELALDELAECVPAGGGVESALDERMLAEAVQRFLGALSDPERRVFVCRYWYLDSIAEICQRSGFSQSKVKSMLHRLRRRLRTHLEGEGYFHES